MTLLNYRKSVAVLCLIIVYSYCVCYSFLYAVRKYKFDMIILFSDNSMPVFCISIFYPDFQSA